MKRAYPFAPPLAAVALLLAGCEREEIRVYTVAKPQKPEVRSRESEVEEGVSRAANPQPARARPQLSYTLPAGWEEAGANQMSLVNFRIKTGAGEASVNITPLAGLAGRESAIVNMWREQVGQPALSETEVAGALTPVEIGGDRGQLFEITGARDGQPLRIVTAFAHRAEGSWFYKLQGPEAVVEAQKAAFVEFLKTVRIGGASGATTSVAPEKSRPSSATPVNDPAANSEFKWSVPAGWKALAAGQMQVAKFAVPEREGAKAEVFVSVFPSESGGPLANVNRWRRQLGLGEIDEAGLKEVTSPIESVPDAVLVDLKNEKRAMLGAIVPRDGKWWFYKMMGDAAAVEPERAAFVAFAKSLP